jgi:sulfane dehydrogenase subunit SoxC
MTREETSKYTDPLADGTVRQFSFVMDAKSVITFPSYPYALPDRGWWEIKGLAWSGRGRITRVEVSTDGGRTLGGCRDAGHPVLPKCPGPLPAPVGVERERLHILSRATDETGYVQPTVQQLWEARGERTSYHQNHQRAWKVARDGAVTFGLGELV